MLPWTAWGAHSCFQGFGMCEALSCYARDNAEAKVHLIATASLLWWPAMCVTSRSVPLQVWWKKKSCYVLNEWTTLMVCQLPSTCRGFLSSKQAHVLARSWLVYWSLMIIISRYISTLMLHLHNTEKLLKINVIILINEHSSEWAIVQCLLFYSKR